MPRNLLIKAGRLWSKTHGVWKRTSSDFAFPATTRLFRPPPLQAPAPALSVGKNDYAEDKQSACIFHPVVEAYQGNLAQLAKALREEAPYSEEELELINNEAAP
ncbi:hypothetical protein WJX72_005405 [[Myrmecia] bisecta]|uniref:Uncharacterized protein n=1 Tax=[Myrmecia] bisecta TaxID=41462 RepID=A0AAW1Q8Y5_9CHLO